MVADVLSNLYYFNAHGDEVLEEDIILISNYKY